MRPASVFSHLAYSVSDLEAMRRFYVEAFGFTAGVPYSSAGRRSANLMGTTAAGFTGLFLRSGDVLIEFLAHLDGERPAETPRRAPEWGYAHISFAVDDIEAAVARALASGGSLYSRLDHRFDPDDPQETKIAFVLDPDGNRVELVEHATAVQAGAHAQYLGMTELGWPAADALAADSTYP